MTITTSMRDNKKTQMREAWQNGRIATQWRKDQIDEMHGESPNIVPEWGFFPDRNPYGVKRINP